MIHKNVRTHYTCCSGLNKIIKQKKESRGKKFDFFYLIIKLLIQVEEDENHGLLPATTSTISPLRVCSLK